jgi:hypothetical protein
MGLPQLKPTNTAESISAHIGITTPARLHQRLIDRAFHPPIITNHNYIEHTSSSNATQKQLKCLTNYHQPSLHQKEINNVAALALTSLFPFNNWSLQTNPGTNPVVRVIKLTVFWKSKNADTELRILSITLSSFIDVSVRMVKTLFQPFIRYS